MQEWTLQVYTCCTSDSLLSKAERFHNCSEPVGYRLTAWRCSQYSSVWFTIGFNYWVHLGHMNPRKLLQDLTLSSTHEICMVILEIQKRLSSNWHCLFGMQACILPPIDLAIIAAKAAAISLNIIPWQSGTFLITNPLVSLGKSSPQPLQKSKIMGSPRKIKWYWRTKRKQTVKLPSLWRNQIILIWTFWTHRKNECKGL